MKSYTVFVLDYDFQKLIFSVEPWRKNSETFGYEPKVFWRLPFSVFFLQTTHPPFLLHSINRCTPLVFLKLFFLSCFFLSISQTWKSLVTARKLNLPCSNFNQNHISPITHPDWICSLRPPYTRWQTLPSFFHTKHLWWYELPDCSYAKNKPPWCPTEARCERSLTESPNASL